MSYSARLDTSNAREQSCVVALHCSLSSGRQWQPLIAALSHRHRVAAPDISGYGDAPLPVHTFLNVSQLAWPYMLVEFDVIAMVPLDRR